MDIGLGFGNNKTEKFIWITEENLKITKDPSRSSSIYLDISGIRVLEEESDLPWSDSTRGLLYAWNQNGVHFNVIIDGFDRSECRKVIESMTKQTVAQPAGTK
jgi:hypothetical protein